MERARKEIEHYFIEFQKKYLIPFLFEKKLKHRTQVEFPNDSVKLKRFQAFARAQTPFFDTLIRRATQQITRCVNSNTIHGLCMLAQQIHTLKLIAHVPHTYCSIA
jgi:hypothetical protein